ncbi:MAG: alkaline phosphatase family protein [Phycisphaerae bacterium]|nr:alkaline phosphatase family protein [Gemmatimonadaceae bacterium]
MKQPFAQALSRTLLLIVADGVRHDVLREEIDRGTVPAIAALCERGSFSTVSTCFPSVTGPGYVPFLTGRFPGPLGVPGLRWFDRQRKIGLWPAYSRSYSGIDIWHLDRDLDPAVPTLFELARPSLSVMSMLGRGAGANIGRSVLFMLRVSPSHFRGDLDAWRGVEQLATRDFFRRFERSRPQFATLAITSADKRAHKEGPTSPGVRAAIHDINAAVVTAQEIATRGGWRDDLTIWLVGDHGHSPVTQHEDLHGWLQQRKLRVRAHPNVFQRSADVALMVGGNAMAHLYVDADNRTRHYWPQLSERWQALHDALLKRPSVDLTAVAMSDSVVRVSSYTAGSADIRRHRSGAGHCWEYITVTGDPLQLGGNLHGLNASAAWEACAHTEYSDAIVQLSSLVTAGRSGDIIVSAARGWDLRSRFEPVVHVSTHGALLDDQMMVPLILDRPFVRTPQRTADVAPSALSLLGLPVPDGLDGRSFL